MQSTKKMNGVVRQNRRGETRYRKGGARGRARLVCETPSLEVAEKFSLDSRATLYHGDCLELLKSMPEGSAQLVVTSPPYNIGKSYEKRAPLDRYLEQQGRVITECARILKGSGSICWQVGNYINGSEVIPLDVVLYPIFQKLGFKLRNRIVWHFEHGLHCSRRFSGRYETINWFSKSDDYSFNLDAVRVPQKYPGKKYFKGPKAGQLSCNPLGKNPGDVWVIPNVKHNHVEKTIHPCQFPVELIERLVLALTRPADLVFDPYLGAGTAAVAAILHDRRAAGAEVVADYVRVAKQRVLAAVQGTLKTRPMNRPIYDPRNTKLSIPPASVDYRYPQESSAQMKLLDRHGFRYAGGRERLNA